MLPNWKPCATARKKAKLKDDREAELLEEKNKREAKNRDGHRCRFPLCGCKSLKLRLEVSHQTHKGAGGNPTGDRSTPDRLLTLCVHRHQHGAVSIHKGTLRARPLTKDGTNGPVAWLVNVELPELEQHQTGRLMAWYEVARERQVQQLEPLTIRQEAILRHLAEMTL